MSIENDLECMNEDGFCVSGKRNTCNASLILGKYDKVFNNIRSTCGVFISILKIRAWK
jgi:hypothetical protein